MPHVIFVAPAHPPGQRRFVRGLKKVGARVTGIGDTPPEQLDPELQYLLDGYEVVGDLSDEDALEAAVRRVQSRGPWVDRLEATLEPHLLAAARVRARTAIPGEAASAVGLSLDRAAVKAYLRGRGVTSAACIDGDDAQRVAAFVDEVGFPVVFKPVGGRSRRLDDAAELAAAAAGCAGPWTLEAFVEGHEGFYDTLTVDGAVVHEFVSHYYPTVLQAMRERWISPQVIATNRVEADGYDPLRALGRTVNSELGFRTTPTHMEWFHGPAGLRFSEIGARPPIASHWDVYGEANGIDLYAEWARAIAYGTTEERPSRRYAAGLINLRPTCDGHIVGYEGVERMQLRYGPGIFKLRLPPIGSPTEPIGSGYLANAYVYVRHPDYDGLREVLDDIGRTVRVIAR